MKQLRYIIAFIILSAFLFSGCSESQPQDPTGQVTKEETVLRAAMFKSPATQAAKDMLNEYEQQAGVEVEFDIYPYVVLREKIASDMLSGAGGQYDIIMMDIPWLPEFADKGWVVPIDSYLKDSNLYDKKGYNESDIIPIVRDALGVYIADNKTYGLPFMTNTHVLAYRKDLYNHYLKPEGIRKPGKTAETAWTWEEYLKAAKLLTRDLDDDGRNDMWGSTLQAKRGNSLVYEWFAYLYSFGGNDFNDKWEPQFSAPKSVDAIEFYIDLYKKHEVAPKSVVTWAHEEETSAITQGLAAMDATWNMELAYWLVNPENSKVHDEIAFAMMPKKKGSTPTPDMGGYSLAISKNSENKKEAFRFITWLTSPQIHKGIVMEGGTPIRYSEIHDKTVLEKYPYYEIYDDVLETSIYRTRIPQWPKISQVLAQELSKAMIGKQNPQETGEEIDREVKEIMQEAGYYD